MMRDLVAGAGSPLRADDGLGVRLVNDLATWIEERGGDARDIGTDACALVAELEERRRVIIIDAVEMELSPGDVRVFDAECVPQCSTPMLSGHEFDLASAVTLARKLHPDVRIEIVGIQPASVERERRFSPEIAARYFAIRKEVKNRLGVMLARTEEAERLVKPVQEERR